METRGYLLSSVAWWLSTFLFFEGHQHFGDSICRRLCTILKEELISRGPDEPADPKESIAYEAVRWKGGPIPALLELLKERRVPCCVNLVTPGSLIPNIDCELAAPSTLYPLSSLVNVLSTLKIKYLIDSLFSDDKKKK